MTPLTAVILAHADPIHLRRLIAALEDIPIVLHCDIKTDPAEYQRMVDDLPSRVTLCKRMDAKLASWSLVEAELMGVRTAVEICRAEHIVVMTGADYPLLSPEQLAAELRQWAGTTWLWNMPMPFSSWDTRRHPDGGLWRMRRRFLVRKNHVIYWHDIPLRLPIKRAIPDELTLRAGSQWKIYSREHALLLLDLVERRPDLVKFWRTTLIPEESFAPTMLGSRALVGSAALPPCPYSAWYLDWNNGSGVHPRWLSDIDYSRLMAVRSAPAVSVEQATAANAITDNPPHDATSYRRLFARKFSHRQSALIDKIDAELRGVSGERGYR